VKVATFNINNINKRLDNLLAWLAKAEPDVVSLQELKAEQGAFPVNALRTLGYEAVWQGERSRNTWQKMKGWRAGVHDVTYEPRQIRGTIGQDLFQRKKEFLNASCR
jgi:exonuclease III